MLDRNCVYSMMQAARTMLMKLYYIADYSVSSAAYRGFITVNSANFVMYQCYINQQSDEAIILPAFRLHRYYNKMQYQQKGRLKANHVFQTAFGHIYLISGGSSALLW